MSFREFIEGFLDYLLPPPKGFPTLDYMEHRHIVRAYLIHGNMTHASRALGYSVRAIRNTMDGLFTRAFLLSLPGNRGRADNSAILYYMLRQFEDAKPPVELPPALARHHFWIERRPVWDKPELSLQVEDEFTYPCHRDFDHWDWYMNQDRLLSPHSYPGKLMTEDDDVETQEA